MDQHLSMTPSLTGMTLLIFFVAVHAFAVPNTIRFQGRLTDSQGTPMVGSDVRVRFALFSVPTGGTSVWDGPSDQTVVTNEAGLFATDVGPVPVNIFSGSSELYIQVSVHDGAAFKVLLPRQKLASVPYSFYAGTADGVVDNSISNSKIQAKSVTSDKLADHAVGTTTVDATVLDRLLPAGLIAMFAGECPAGWVPFTELNNRFPLGKDHYDSATADGGSNNVTGLSTLPGGAHVHQVNSHTHGVTGSTYEPTTPQEFTDIGTGQDWVWFNRPKLISGVAALGGGDLVYLRGYEHYHFFSLTSGSSSPMTGTDQDSNGKSTHAHQIASDGSWLPPYHTVVYCEKR